MNKFVQAILAIIRALFGRGRSTTTPRTTTGTRAGTVTTRPPDTVRDPVAWAAAELNAELAAVKAVLEIESGGKGMLAAGRAVIRFEGATFHRLTGGAHDQTHPHLSMRNWRDNSPHVVGGSAEWGRLEQAAALNREAAYKSASYGAAQIMGFNYQTAGYPDVFAFVADMNDGEAGQIRAFVNFLKGKRLDGDLRAKDWRAFARGYNGTGQVERYARLLEQAYIRHAGAPEPAPEVVVPPDLFPPSRMWDDYRQIPIAPWRQRWPNFTAEEIGRKTQRPADRSILVVPAALDKLQALRVEWGRPIKVNSGYRSPEYNRLVGGSTGSKHMEGIAFDCSMPGTKQDDFITMAVRHGFNGIGRYPTFVHIDARSTPARWTG